LLVAGGIRLAGKHRAGQGLPDGVGLAADPFLLSRRQRLCGTEGRPSQPAGRRRVISHRETRFVPYPAALMYEVVSDVEKYPQFLPWVVALRVLSRGENRLTAEM